MFSFFKRKKKVDDTLETVINTENTEVDEISDTAQSLAQDTSAQNMNDALASTDSPPPLDPITTTSDLVPIISHTELETESEPSLKLNQTNENTKKSWLGNLFGKKTSDKSQIHQADPIEQVNELDRPDSLDLDAHDFQEPIILEDPALDDLSEEDFLDQSPQTNPSAKTENNVTAPETAKTSLSDAEQEKQAKKTWFSNLKKGLNKTGDSISFAFKRVTIDETLMDELEESLIMSDSGIEAACIVVENLRQKIKKAKPDTLEQIRELLAQCIADELRPLEKTIDIENFKPNVMMMVGVNGVGKTTTIGKLAKHLLSADYTVLLAAGDTFRAAAREQLTAWGDRNQITVISQEGADPAAVIFDAVQSAKAKGIDVVMADTAGRLPTQAHLMEELKKIKRVITKADATAPHEVLLVIDANNGQNALNQVVAFHETIGLTGLIVTKLDGTAKGGIVLAIASKCPVPIYFIGVGEKAEDLMPFDALNYGRAMVGLEQD